MNLYLLRYNNYYNRIIKREETIDGYRDAAEVVAVQERGAFDPNDGITTRFVMNYDGKDANYCVVTDEMGEIISRWYVVDNVRTRATQYWVYLLRDVVAEYYEDIMNCTAYIEKAAIRNINDPAIYNTEQLQVNQILTQKTPIYDETGTNWIVGFMPTNLPDEITNEVEVTYNDTTAIQFAEQVDGIANWSLYSQLDNEYDGTLNSLDVISMYRLGNTNSYTAAGLQFYSYKSEYLPQSTMRSKFGTVSSSGDGYATGIYPNIAVSGTTTQTNGIAISSYIRANADYSAIFAAAKTAYPEESPEIASFLNKYVYDTASGLLYKVGVRQTSASRDVSISAGNLLNVINEQFSGYYSANGYQQTFTATGPYTISLNQNKKSYYLEPIQTRGTFSLENRPSLNDAPYSMWCMPYSSSYEYYVNEVAYQSNKNLALSVATSIAAKLGTKAIYDVQLLPYCPLRDYLVGGSVYATNAIATEIIGQTTDQPSQGRTIGHIFWATSSSASFEVENIKIEVPNDPTQFKIANQCDMYRLVSPTDGSAFEFSATKNRGVSAINISFTYKPFSSYIRVAPRFDGLYGKDFDWEKRGLVLRGDFSMPQVSNEWANYRLSNINYENIFNRQMESMELKNTWGLVGDIVNATTGAAAIAGTGAIAFGAGAMNSLAGAAIGGASLAAGAFDVAINQVLRQDTLDYTKDLYNFSLGNIQALPNTLTKIGAFDIDCSPVPVLEYYTCTDIEKEAFSAKLIYNGMTVMRIGRVSNFVYDDDNYIKCKIIRYDEFAQDIHILNKIAEELNKGVFISTNLSLI